MKKAVAMVMLLAGGMFAAPRVNIGIGFRAPAPVAVVRPACPGPGYTWVDGYYGANGVFVNGYWAPPVVVRPAPHIDRYTHARIDVHDRFDNRGRGDRDDHRR